MEHANARASNRERLKEVIQQEGDALTRAARLFAARAGLAASLAGDIVGEMTVEALEHADRFDPSRQAYPWLLGIAANIVRRRQAELGKRDRREPLARDVAADPAISDDELFDRLFPPRDHDPGERLEQDQQVEAMLRLVSPEDRQVIRLAVLHEVNGDALASALGVQPGAARVRLHRALLRLKKALQAQEKRQ